MKKLQRGFYTRSTLTVAKDLLGKFIVRREGKPRRKASFLEGKIIETEAYIGPKDKASHAFQNKKTPRNWAEYLIGGHIYIYLVYGMYWQLNISTGKEGRPECVLIRALEAQRANGPGKLCRYLKLDYNPPTTHPFYGEDLTKSKRIWLEDRGVKVKKGEVIASERIGIDYAGEWTKKLWRFYLKNNPFVSKR